MRRFPATIAVLAFLAAPAGAAASGTQASVFHAFTTAGKPTIRTRPASGYCWTGSSAINRRDAWRCFVRNNIYDPCFAAAKAHSVVVCPSATVSAGIEIRLTKPLPYRYADTGRPTVRNAPWLIETATGARCLVATGATSVVDKQRFSYACSRTVGLWGIPNRNARPLWTILIAPYNATRLTQRTGIRHVWM